MSMNFGCKSVVFVPHVVVGYDTHAWVKLLDISDALIHMFIMC